MITQLAQGSAKSLQKQGRRKRRSLMKRNAIRNADLYLFLLPTLIYFAIFHYAPMYGLQIAFKDFKATKGIWGSEWVGFEHFIRFFHSAQFWDILLNTIILSLESLIFGFFPPIILALMLNQVENQKFKKIVQGVTYAPHFISTVVMVSLLYCLLSTRNGIVNRIIEMFGGTAVPFMRDAEYFRGTYVVSGIWQEMGFSAIIYIAALAGISAELHEAAIIDGANKLQRIWHIDIPGILPTITILLIMKSGSIMSVGFEKVFLMQTSLNLKRSQVISTYVYQVGLVDADFSFSEAVGFFNSIVNFIMIMFVNFISGRVSETSLW